MFDGQKEQPLGLQYFGHLTKEAHQAGPSNNTDELRLMSQIKQVAQQQVQ